MENVLFKISFPAEFHAQTAAEAAIICRNLLKDRGLNAPQDIKSVRIRTQEAAMCIINKFGPLYNYADRDHCLQYIVAVPLIYGRLTTDDYNDAVASDPRIDAMRAKMTCVEDIRFTQEYHDPDKRYIGNAIKITLNDGTELEEVEVNYPIGHRKRREEGKPLLMEKFERNLRGRFDEQRVQKILEQSQPGFESTDIDDYVSLYV
jgi:2-methylcitrate dehydratase